MGETDRWTIHCYGPRGTRLMAVTGGLCWDGLYCSTTVQLTTYQAGEAWAAFTALNCQIIPVGRPRRNGSFTSLSTQQNCLLRVRSAELIIYYISRKMAFVTMLDPPSLRLCRTLERSNMVASRRDGIFVFWGASLLSNNEQCTHVGETTFCLSPDCQPPRACILLIQM